ncbi:hypothetical protein ACP4OV_001962 [Aristida adscensionis]
MAAAAAAVSRRMASSTCLLALLLTAGWWLAATVPGAEARLLLQSSTQPQLNTNVFARGRVLDQTSVNTNVLIPLQIPTAIGAHVRPRRAPAGARRRGGARHAGVAAVAHLARAPRRRPRGARAHLGHRRRGRPPPRRDQAGRRRRRAARRRRRRRRWRLDGAAPPAVGQRAPAAHLRRRLICVVGLQFFQEASGIEAIVLYSPLVFKRAGMSSNGAVLGATVAVGVVKTVFILVATLLSDRLGRRPLLLASTAGVAAAMASLVAALRSGSTSLSVASVLAFVVAFSVGLGPLVPAYGAEVLPLRLRAQGTGLGTAAGRLTCGVVSMTFITLADTITMPGASSSSSSSM